MGSTVASGELQHRPRGLAADSRPCRARIAAGQRARPSMAAHDRRLRGEHLDERVVGGLRDGGVYGGIFRRAIETGEALMATVNRVDRLVDREVHDGHRTAGTPRPSCSPKFRSSPSATGV